MSAPTRSEVVNSGAPGELIETELAIDNTLDRRAKPASARSGPGHRS
jgi:hypothetical protein